MDEQYSINDLTADELAELLSEDGATLCDKQAIAIKEFVEQIGGVENARLAIELLKQLDNAA